MSSENTALVVGEKNFTTDDVLKYMRLTEEWDKNVGAFLRREALFLLAETKGVKVSDADLQVEVDLWRKLNNQHQASATQNWLEDTGMSLVDLEHECEAKLLERRLRAAVPQDLVDEYFDATKQSYDQARLCLIQVTQAPLAAELASQIEEEDEEFGDLALEHSVHESASRGGALGLMARSSLPESQAAKFFSGDEGSVYTFEEGGLHSIFRVEKIKPAVLDAAVQKAIRSNLLESALLETLGVETDEVSDEEE